MDCDRALELLSARLDEPLTDQEERELEEHLAGCPDCRALAEQLDQLRAGFADLEELKAPEGFAEGVMARIGREKKVIPLFRRPWSKALAGLAACVAVCVGLYGAGLLDMERKMPALTDQSSADVSIGVYSALPNGAEDAGPSVAAAQAPQSDEGEGLTAAPRTVENDASEGVMPLSDVGTVLRLEALPQEVSDLLPGEEQWETDESGTRWCQVPAETLKQIRDVLTELGLPAEFPEEPWQEPCVVLVAP